MSGRNLSSACGSISNAFYPDDLKVTFPDDLDNSRVDSNCSQR